MSEQADQTAGTALTVQQRASVALGSSAHETKLRDLVKQSAEITAITNPAGYQQVHASRMALKRERVALEKEGKGAREDAREFVTAVIAEEKRLIGIISSEEERLQVLQDVHDAKIAAEKAARELAEAERVARIQSRIENDIRLAAQSAFGNPAGAIATILVDIRAIEVDDTFAEFKERAEAAKVQAVTQLERLHGSAVAHEAEQKQLAEARAELGRRQAEQAEREREEQARRDEEARAREEENRKRAHEEAQRKAQQALEERQRADETAAAARAREAAEAESRRRIEGQEKAARELREEQDRAARLQREAEERAAHEAALHRQAAMGEIEGIQHQVLIAQTGRLGVRAGGTINCIVETLAETEAWPITAEKFGSFLAAAQNARDQAVATIRGLLETAKQRAAEDAARQADLDRLAEERRAAEERDRVAREEAEAKARAEREALEAAARRQREEDEARERAEREEAERVAKVERERVEAEQRERQRLVQDSADLREICVTVTRRFHDRQDAAFLVEAARAYLVSHPEEEAVPA